MKKARAFATAAFEYGFCPAVLVLSVAAVWFARRHGVPWMRALFLTSIAPILLITVVEYIRPYRKDWNLPFRAAPKEALKELGKDLVYMLFVTRIHSFVLPTILTLLAPHAKAMGKAVGVYHVMSAWHPAVRIVALLLVSELFWYWGHRLQHHNAFFWRFHSTHHMPEKLSALKASRNHPADMLFLSIISSVPLMALGAIGTDVMWAVFIQSIVNVTSHANVGVRGGLYGWFFATPDYHRVHHSAILEESRSNYGCRLLVWDRAFGTFKERAAHGDRIVVGVDPLGERSFKEELIEPLYRRARTS